MCPHLSQEYHNEHLDRQGLSSLLHPFKFTLTCPDQALYSPLCVRLYLLQEYHNELLLIYLQELQQQQLRLGQQQQQYMERQQHDMQHHQSVNAISTQP